MQSTFIQNNRKVVRAYRMSKSTRRIKTAPGQPVPAISGVEPRNLTMSILTFNPLKREQISRVKLETCSSQYKLWKFKKSNTHAKKRTSKFNVMYDKQCTHIRNLNKNTKIRLPKHFFQKLFMETKIPNVFISNSFFWQKWFSRIWGYLFYVFSKVFFFMKTSLKLVLKTINLWCFLKSIFPDNCLKNMETSFENH